MKSGTRVLVRGAGDLASGTLHRLLVCGYRVGALEVVQPRAVRRTVSFCEAVYDGVAEVEGVKARLIETSEFRHHLGRHPDFIPIAADPEGTAITEAAPDVVVDARMLKRKSDTRIGDVPLVVGLGPGLVAGDDVDVVIETKRGHNLGKCIRRGSASPDTGIPAAVEGYSIERVLLSPANGRFIASREIGDIVEEGETVAHVSGSGVNARISGMIRGLIRDGLEVCEGEKVGDVDPRGDEIDYRAISDKARAIAGGVLEALLSKGFLP